MVRTINFYDEGFEINFSSLIGIFSKVNNIYIPYNNIESVYTEYFKLPFYAVSQGGMYSENTAEGIFKIGKKTYLLSFYDSKNLLIIDLFDMNYDKIVIEVENPEYYINYIKYYCN